MIFVSVCTLGVTRLGQLFQKKQGLKYTQGTFLLLIVWLIVKVLSPVQYGLNMSA